MSSGGLGRSPKRTLAALTLVTDDGPVHAYELRQSWERWASRDWHWRTYWSASKTLCGRLTPHPTSTRRAVEGLTEPNCAACRRIIAERGLEVVAR